MSMQNKKTIDDVMVCPYCDSSDCYQYNTDEIEFDSDNTGHYFSDCHCNNCNKNFRFYSYFNYNVTQAYTYAGCGKDKQCKEIYKETEKC